MTQLALKLAPSTVLGDAHGGCTSLCSQHTMSQPMEHKLQFLVLLNLCSKVLSIEINGFYQLQFPFMIYES